MAVEHRTDDSDQSATGNGQGLPPGVQDDGLGRDATKPTQIPAKGWTHIAKRAVGRIKTDQLPLVAAGVAFYAMLALFPSLTALVSVYGLIADPEQIQEQIDNVAGGMAGGAGDLIVNQAQSIAGASTGALSTGLIVSIVAALWTSSSGMQGLMQALTLANNEEETRGFIAKRGTALLLTIISMVVLIAAAGVIIFLPVAMRLVGMEGVGQWLIQVGSLPLVGVVIFGVLALIYRFGPDRDGAKWRWVSVGALDATVLWIVASVGFTVYVSNFGNYNETYGTMEIGR